MENVILLICLCTHSAAEGHALALTELVQGTETIVPVPEIQTQIKRCIEVCLAGENKDRLVAELGQLWKLSKTRGKDHHQVLILQLVYYSAHESRSTEQWAAVTTVHKYLGLSEREFFRTIVPYISTPDEAVRKYIRELIPIVERDGANAPPNFLEYESYIESSKGSPPLGLIEYMFQRSAGNALLAMMRVHVSDREEQKRILWAQYLVSDVLWKQQHAFLNDRQAEPAAVKHLDSLSRAPEWWARLYVAAVVARNPEFQVGDMVRRLKADEHPLVRKFAAEAKEWTLRLPAPVREPPENVVALHRELAEAERIVSKEQNPRQLDAIYDRSFRGGAATLEILLDVMYPESQPDDKRYPALGRFASADDFLRDRLNKMHIDDAATLELLTRRVLIALDAGRPVPKDLFMSSSVVRAIIASGKKEYIDRLRPLLNHPDSELARLVSGWMDPEPPEDSR